MITLLDLTVATFSNRRFAAWFLVLVFFGFPCAVIRAQGGIDYTGTGGRHTIEGRIYFASGRKADSPGIKITLESGGSSTLKIFTDFSGTFSFRNLAAGSYTVVIEPTDDYEGVRESVYIDDPGSSNIRTSSLSVSGPPRLIIVPIYLLSRNRPNASAKAGVVDATLASVPKPALEIYYEAMESIRGGDSRKGISELETAVRLYPQFPRALNELGVQYLKVGQVNKAIVELQLAVRYAPDEFIPRLNYGIALLEKKDFVEAEAQLRRALQKNDTAATAHMYLGITLIQRRSASEAENKVRYAEAEKELQRAVSLGADQVVLAHYYLGGIYWRNGEHRRAADELETYLKLAPNAPDAERTRAAIKDLRRRGD